MADKKKNNSTNNSTSVKSEKKQSDVSVMLKEAAILFAITLISGLVLGFVYEVTKEPIRIQQEKAVQEACMAVFPGAEDLGITFEELTYEPNESLAAELAANGVTVGTVFEAKDGSGAFYGYVVQSATAEGYAGDIVLYVGVKADASVSGVSIMEIGETPGLGMEAPKVLVPQFAGKQVNSFTYTKTGSMSDSEVDAISGATITTKAVVNAVNGGLATAKSLMEGGALGE